MGMQGFALFMRLAKDGHCPEQMGFNGTNGDVVRRSSRVKLARNFRGVQIDDYSERTLLGYGGFFRVFLTHSALERYLPIIGLAESGLTQALSPHNPHETIQRFFAGDRSGKLFNFLHSRLNKKLQNNLTACREGTCADVTCLSASVRHIFAHGHLTANASDINPNQVAKACECLSEFLLDFMERDFGQRIAEYYERVARTANACQERKTVGA
jgi:hypothetical protein